MSTSCVQDGVVVKEAWLRSRDRKEVGFVKALVKVIPIPIFSKPNSNEILDYGKVCYFTDTANCFQMLPQDFTPKAQNKRFNCLTHAKHFRCGHGVDHMCYSKTHKFTDSTTLVLKGCSSRVLQECPISGNNESYHYYIGKDLKAEPICDFCDGYLCNNKTSIHKVLECFVTPYKDCLAVPQNNESLTVSENPKAVKLMQNKKLGCLKSTVMKQSVETCTQECGQVFLITHKDNEVEKLVFRDCGENIKKLLSKSFSEDMQAAIGRIVFKATELCSTEDRCNHRTLEFRTGLACYQSSLMACLENLTLIIPPERMFECVKKMNRHKVSKECKNGEKCTTISLHRKHSILQKHERTTLCVESEETINYLTCGTGPKGLCESMIKAINLEKYIGKKVVNTECKYCEHDHCNSITEEEDASEKSEIHCYFSDFDLCTKKFFDKTKPSPTNLKKIQEEIYDCFKAKPNKTRSCRRCLTATFIFYEDKVLQAAFCESVARRLDPCYIPQMERPYFKKYTGLTLAHTRCSRCLTPKCNNFTISSRKKSEVVATSLARYQMYNFALILVFICIIVQIL